MDPSIIKDMIRKHNVVIRSDEDDLMFIYTVLIYYTVDECVHMLKESGSQALNMCSSGAVILAYSINRFECAEVMIKLCMLTRRYPDYAMENLIENNNYKAAKHFVACGYTLRDKDQLPYGALDDKKWLKFIMEDADGMHLLFKKSYLEWTPLECALMCHSNDQELLQYLRQLQFLSSYIILTAPQRHSHGHKRRRMNAIMPLDMFRLIGAMLV